MRNNAKNEPVRAASMRLALPKQGGEACSCGVKHPLQTREVLIGRGAIRLLAKAVEACGLSGVPLSVYDENTLRVAGKSVRGALPTKEFVFKGSKTLPCDGASLARLERAIPPGCPYLVAVGSGTLNDLVKVAASRRKIPFAVVATAPSMDGYLSANAGILIQGVKTPFTNLAPALAVVADTALFRTAPLRMIRAGVGDALGKYVANAEWRLGTQFGLEAFCPKIWKRVKVELDALLDAGAGGNRSSDAFLEALMRTLMVTGIAMQMTGNSFPASGAEHHISHALEMHGYARKGHAPSLHGLQVAFGTWHTMACYGEVFRALRTKKPLSVPVALYEGHIADWKMFGIDLDAGIRKKIALLSRLPGDTRALRRIVNAKPLATFFRDRVRMERLYRDFQLPRNAKALGISASEARFAVEHAVDLRVRITILDLVLALGLMPGTLSRLQ